jgi:hypothetical protein
LINYPADQQKNVARNKKDEHTQSNIEGTTIFDLLAREKSL